MTTRVELVEPWGDHDDSCGDGSCGISNPDDTKFALRYTVTVPRSFSGRFDAASCPGSLHVANGNDDDALISVAADEGKSLSGAVLPGTTKYCVDVYSIEKNARGEDFFIEPTCGDIDMSSDIAYWGGKISADNPRGLRDVGKMRTASSFTVMVSDSDTSHSDYRIKAEVCLRSVPAGYGPRVPTSLDPWSVKVAGQTIRPKLRGTTFKTAKISGGNCNSGTIAFSTDGAKVSAIVYANSLHERATWR
jgi:hypothetical protein